MSQKVRESNFELLRIVAILFITMHHLLIMVLTCADIIVTSY